MFGRVWDVLGGCEVMVLRWVGWAAVGWVLVGVVVGVGGRGAGGGEGGPGG